MRDYLQELINRIDETNFFRRAESAAFQDWFRKWKRVYFVEQQNGAPAESVGNHSPEAEVGPDSEPGGSDSGVSQSEDPSLDSE